MRGAFTLALVVGLTACAPSSGAYDAEFDPVRATRFAGSSLPAGTHLVTRYDLVGNNDEQQDVYIDLQGGHCYWIIGASQDSIRELALFLWDPSGDRISSAKRSSSPVLKTCPGVGGQYHVGAKVHVGAGRYTLALYERQEQTSAASTPPSDR